MKKTIIKFEKSDCQPCKSVSQHFLENGIIHESINAFDNPDMARAYRVKSVPTVVLLVDGTEIKRSVGFKIQEIEEIIYLFNN